MKIKFAKMNASGNDFIVIDNREKIMPGNLAAAARKLCRRKVFVGADGLLLIGKSKVNDFRMRIFNPDGSEPEMCGNGARCIARYAYINRIAGRKMIMQTLSGPVGAEIKSKGVKIKMKDPAEGGLNFDLKIKNRKLNVSFIDTGVPHTVVFTEKVEDVDVRGLGRAIRYDKMFSPAGANVNFVSVKGRNSIIIRTYERGVEDETLSCGTGSVASAIISGVVQGIVPPVKVHTRGGEVLMVYYNITKTKDSFPMVKDVYLEGGAEIAYEGVLSDLRP